MRFHFVLLKHNVALAHFWVWIYNLSRGLSWLRRSSLVLTLSGQNLPLKFQVCIVIDEDVWPVDLKREQVRSDIVVVSRLWNYSLRGEGHRSLNWSAKVVDLHGYCGRCHHISSRRVALANLLARGSEHFGFLWGPEWLFDMCAVNERSLHYQIRRLRLFKRLVLLLLPNALI